MSGYNFVAYGAMGDQPGQHAWHYLAPWQTLPDGTFIALQKFIESPVLYYTITDPVDPGKYYNIYGFTNMLVPFPTEGVSNYLYLPCRRLQLSRPVGYGPGRIHPARARQRAARD